MKAVLIATILVAAISGASSATALTSQVGARTYMVRAGAGEPVLAPFEHVRFCMRQPEQCAAVSRGGDVIALDDFTRDELHAVNRSVNAGIYPERKTDRSRFEGEWAIHPVRGDCNDYAVTKRSELIQRGYPSSALLLSVVQTGSGEGHLVLLVRTSSGDLVLDNLSSALRPWQATGYRWLSRQSDLNPQYWVSIRLERKSLGPMLVAELRGTTVE